MKPAIIRSFAFLLAICCMIFSLTACGETGNAPSDVETEIETNTDNTLADSSSTLDEPPKHEYLSGYEEIIVYQEIEQIEQCTSPDTLCQILSEIYEDEISYIELDAETVKNEYIIQILAMYNVDLVKVPLTSRVFVFLRPYQETPVFIMDEDGSYPVSTYEIKTTEDGNSYSKLSAWQATDLFLCLHSFAKCEDNIDDRADLVTAVQALEWYMDFESRVILNTYRQNGTNEVFEQIAPEDTRAEWLYPIMDGTLASRIDAFIEKAVDISSGDGPIYEYEALYPHQDEIRNTTAEVELIVGNNGANDRLLLNYFDDVGKIDFYIEEFITFASQGFNDPRIEEYTTFCYELSSPLKAIETFLQMK